MILRKAKSTKWVLSSLLIAASALIMSNSEATPAPISVTVNSAVRVNSESMVTVVGTVTASKAATLGASSSGPITQVAVKSGQMVEKGQLLFQLEDAVQKAALASAEAKAQVSAARYQRSLKLSEGVSGLSQQNLEEYRSAYEQDKASVDMAKALLQSRRVVAPFSGTTGVSMIHAGDYVSPGKGLLSLVSYKDPQVSFSVPERAIKGVQVGKEVEISTPLLPGKMLKAKITFVSPTIDRDSRTLLCMATFENEAKDLRPGTFVEVDFSIKEKTQAVKIPEKALVLDTNGYFVYRVVKNKAVKTPVVVGSRCQGNVFITHGLRTGESVVTSGQGKLANGKLVSIHR